MDKTKRSLRRSHRNRIIRRTVFMIKNQWRVADENDEEIELRARRLADNRQERSDCLCCGNPRRVSWSRVGKMTLQERRQEEEERCISRMRETN